MSKGGSSSQAYALPTYTSQTSNTSSTIPSWMTAASQQGVNNAGALLNAPTPTYGGELSPGLTADQQAAGDMLRNSVGAYQGYFDTARSLTDAGTQQAPQIDPQTYRESLAGVGDYMNPYIGQVIGGLRQAAAENLGASLNRTADQAIGAHAFGGSRQGVMEGVATAGANNALNNQIGQLLSGGYDRATSLMGADINNNLQAQGANQTAYQQYMNRLLGAGAQQAQIGTANRAANVADINNVLQYGSLAQQTQAAQDQAAYQNWLYQQNYPFLQQQAYNQTMQASPYDRYGTTTTNGWTMSPEQQQQSGSALMGGLGGAMTGAQLGSYFGPYGTAIGAVGGGLLGTFGAR